MDRWDETTLVEVEIALNIFFYSSSVSVFVVPPLLAFILHCHMLSIFRVIPVSHISCNICEQSDLLTSNECAADSDGLVI